MKTILALSIAAMFALAMLAPPAESRIGDRRANRHVRHLSRIENRQHSRAARQHLRGGLMSRMALRRGDLRGLVFVPVEQAPSEKVPAPMKK